jgi:hypothetical protein
MLSENYAIHGYLQRVIFKDEATLHINGCVNRYNFRIWGSQQPNKFFEYVRDTPKMNVYCEMLHGRVAGLFFSVDRTITAEIYLELSEYFFRQVDDNERQNATGAVYQQAGARLHFTLHVCLVCKARLPSQWTGSGGSTAWPPRSTDLTPLDSFMCGTRKTLSMPKNSLLGPYMTEDRCSRSGCHPGHASPLMDGKGVPLGCL